MENLISREETPWAHKSTGYTSPWPLSYLTFLFLISLACEKGWSIPPIGLLGGLSDVTLAYSELSLFFF